MDVPSIRLVSGLDVLAEGDVDVVFDRDLIGVIQNDEVPELLVPSQGGGFGRDSLLKVTITRDDIDEMVER